MTASLCTLELLPHLPVTTKILSHLLVVERNRGILIKPSVMVPPCPTRYDHPGRVALAILVPRGLRDTTHGKGAGA